MNNDFVSDTSTESASADAPREELVEASREQLTETTESLGATVMATAAPRQELTSPPRQELIDAPEFFDSYTWTATCATDSDCVPTIRTRVPGFSEPIAAGICECYADSLVDPLDECQGDNDGCPIAKCYEALCVDAMAFCNNGVCELEYTDEEIIAHSEDDIVTGIMSMSMPAIGVDGTDDSIANDMSMPEDIGTDNANDALGTDGMSMPSTPDWCTDNTQCPEGQECVDRSSGMCFLPPCGRCETVKTNALNFKWTEFGARRATAEINLSMSMPSVLVQHPNSFQFFQSVEISEEVVEFSSETEEFGETGEFSLTCNNHEACASIDGCCLSDGLCHPKTESMPICWTAL